MKEYNFKKHQLNQDEKLWFAEILKFNFDKVDAKSTKVRLWNKISRHFNPNLIDFRFVRNNRLTLLGLWYVDPQNQLFDLVSKVTNKIKETIIDYPDLTSIDTNDLASLGISEKNIKITLTFINDLGLCNGGGGSSQENVFSVIHFNSDSTSFDKILSFDSVDEELENFYNKLDPKKSNILETSQPSTIRKSQPISQKVLDKNKLRKLSGRLNGIREVILKDAYVRKEIGDDYNLIVKQIEKLSSEDLSEFLLAENFWHYNHTQEKWCYSDKISYKLFQLIPFLEEEIVDTKDSSEIDILFNSIIDKELKSRCSDILVAQSHYDRVINQSTQVLEDRIRKKANAERSLVGTQLVNKILNTDISRSVLKLSDNPEEHEGICHICRGIMLAFRNPSHHHLTEKYTQTGALKFCSFIDNILQIIDNAEINNETTINK